MEEAQVCAQLQHPNIVPVYEGENFLMDDNIIQ